MKLNSYFITLLFNVIILLVSEEFLFLGLKIREQVMEKGIYLSNHRYDESGAGRDENIGDVENESRRSSLDSGVSGERVRGLCHAERILVVPEFVVPRNFFFNLRTIRITNMSNFPKIQRTLEYRI